MEAEFLALVNEHQKIIHYTCRTYARTLEREDMRQEILAAAWVSFPKFERRSPFGEWFFGLCRNVCVNHLRKHLQRPDIYRARETITRDLPDENDNEAQEELTRAYHAAIGSLTHIEKRYMQMYLGDLSYEQMAYITGVDASTLRVRVHRIKNKLRSIYAAK